MPWRDRVRDAKSKKEAVKERSARLRKAYAEYREQVDPKFGYEDMRRRWGWSSKDISRFKGHTRINGPNGFNEVDGRKYADLFGVRLEWLMVGSEPMREDAPLPLDTSIEVNVQVERAIKKGVSPEFIKLILDTLSKMSPEQAALLEMSFRLGTMQKKDDEKD